MVLDVVCSSALGEALEDTPAPDAEALPLALELADGLAAPALELALGTPAPVLAAAEPGATGGALEAPPTEVEHPASNRMRANGSSLLMDRLKDLLHGIRLGRSSYLLHHDQAGVLKM